ncbi:diguanylate cyclase [Porticoccaceae bacterium LTM1]|nr:diguanylate cyclase [Porticoccaceae bacterium LTM1]
MSESISVVTGDQSDCGSAKSGQDSVHRERLLQRIGSELSKVAQGKDPILDKILEQLYLALQEGANNQALSRVADYLFQYLLLNDTKTDHKRFQPIAEALQDLLEELQVPVESYNRAQKLTEEAGRATSIEEVVSVLKQGVALLKEINQFVDSPLKPAIPNDPPNNKAEKSREKSWLRRLSWLSHDELSAEEIFDSLRPLLDRLLDKIEVLGESSKQLVIIKALLPNVKEPRDMQRVLEQVLDMLANIATDLNDERKETESFLGALREQLQHVEQGLVNTLDPNQLERVECLNNEISEHVDSIQQIFEQTDSKENIRGQLAQKATSINQLLQGYLVAERQRCEQQERQIKDLTRKMREIEVESQELRAKVQDRQLAASRDSLTGALNRFGYEERVVEEFARSRRIGRPLSMMVVDVDNFKIVNDTYGHKAGDLVLQKVVELMRVNLRKTDCIARYGGDEFVVLLVDSDLDGAKIAAEKLRQAVEQCGFHNGGSPVKVTICCGVTQVRDDDTPETAFVRADSGMYAAKRANRNGVQDVN